MQTYFTSWIKSQRIVFVTVVLMILSWQGRSQGLEEYLNGIARCGKSTVFVKDADFYDPDISIEISGYAQVTIDSTDVIVWDVVSVSDTTYFEYLGHVTLDPLDSANTTVHALRFKLSSVEFSAEYESRLYFNVVHEVNGVVGFALGINRPCQACDIAPGRIPTMMLYTILPNLTFLEWEVIEGL